jgi:methionine sulfoxide reductase heme-binding subunit
MNDFTLRLKRHYLPLLVLVLIAMSVFYFSLNSRDAITFIAQSTGYISVIILTISLLIGPVNLILKNKNPVSTYLRRDISIMGGVLAVLHSITGLFVHLRGKTWQYFLTMSDHGYALRHDNFGMANYTGLLSAIIIILLLITSNDYMLRKLKPDNWKNIQRLSYLMFILTIFHCYFYRIGKDNINPIYYLYIPLTIIVLSFQIIGIWLKLNKKNNVL